MHAPYHDQLTRTALAGRFAPAALDEIAAANLRQDSLVNLLRSKYHFDANAFAEAGMYVLEQESLAVRCVVDQRAVDARQAFGRLIHALQDFYAHTNYIALWVEAHPDSMQNEVIDPRDPEVLESGRLIAARVYYPLEAFTIFPALTPALRKRLPADSHANMNLDSPDRGPLFPLAMAAARRRTKLAFDEIAERIILATRGEGLPLFTALK